METVNVTITKPDGTIIGFVEVEEPYSCHTIATSLIQYISEQFGISDTEIISPHPVPNVTTTNKELPPYVYLVRRNSDTNEGRGPMVVDSIWQTRESAALYIDYKPGVMGRTEKWSDQDHGDWEIEEAMVLTSVDDKDKADEEAARAKALAKLSPNERVLLGFA